MELEYNTTRESMVISEYGRSIQKMVEHIITLEDRDTRTRLAKALVNTMALLNPQLKDQGDFRQKLWDHLHVISGFRLDVDSPYPAPTSVSLATAPERILYGEKTFRYGHYGRNIEKIIRKAAELDDSPEKEALIKSIGNHLKKAYLTWNRDSVNDEVIYAHVRELSAGALTLSEDTRLHHTSELIGKPPVNIKRDKYRQKNGGHYRKRKK